MCPVTEGNQIQNLTIELGRLCQAFKLTRVFKASLFLDEIPVLIS